MVNHGAKNQRKLNRVKDIWSMIKKCTWFSSGKWTELSSLSPKQVWSIWSLGKGDPGPFSSSDSLRDKSSAWNCGDKYLGKFNPIPVFGRYCFLGESIELDLRRSLFARLRAEARPMSRPAAVAGRGDMSIDLLRRFFIVLFEIIFAPPRNNADHGAGCSSTDSSRIESSPWPIKRPHLNIWI